MSIENRLNDIFDVGKIEEFSTKSSVKLAKEQLVVNQILAKRSNLFSEIFAEPSLDLLLKILEKRLKDSKQKRKGAYLLYLLFKKYGKQGGFWRLTTGKEAKELLNHKDKDIRDGAKIAQDELDKLTQ